MDVMTRLLWKELRTQAHLWLAMLFGVFLLSLSVTLSAKNPPGMSDALIGLVYVLTAGFSAASAAVLFAGEAEEGQADWLRQLPMKTPQLIVGKMGFGLLATVLLLGASYLVACGVAWMQGFLLRPQFVPPWSSMLSIAACFVWGVLFSAILNRVLASIVAAALATLVTQAVLSGVFQNHVASDVAHAAVLLVVAAIDCWLLGRWHRNQVVRRWVALRTEPSGNSLSSIPLQWLVTTGPVQVRRWTVLLWKDLQGAFTLVVGAILVLISASWLTERTYVGPWHVMLLAATIVLFGLRSFRSEQREGVIAFLTDRGVPGTRVWLVKVAVWLTAAVIAVGGFLVYEYWPPFSSDTSPRGSLLSQGLVAEVPYARLSAESLDPALRTLRQRNLQEIRLSLAGVLFVGLFAIGHVASFWIRRPILGFAAAFLGGALFIFWAVAMTSIDVPLSVTVWPAAVLFLIAVWDTRHFWMEQRTGWRVRGRQVVWIVFPMVMCVVLAAVWRGRLVPETSPGFDWKQYSHSMQQFDPVWSERWYQAATSSPGDLLPLVRRLEQGTRSKQIDPLLMASFTGSPRVIPMRSALDRLEANFPPGPKSTIGTPFESESKEFYQRLLKGQLERFRTSLTGVQYLTSQATSWEDFTMCLQAEKRLLARVREWSASSEQSPELLEEGLRWLDQMIRSAGEAGNLEADFREMVKRRYVVLNGLFTGEGPVGERIHPETRRDAGMQAWVFPSWIGKPERDRRANLLSMATAAELRMPLATIPELLKPENRPSVWASSGFDYQRFALTTSQLPSELRDEAAIVTTDEVEISQQQTAILKALQARALTVVAVAFQWHRLKQTKFPESLDDLADSPVPLPIDPVWGAPFAYTRGDDREKAFRAVGRFIPGQPFLSSGVPEHWIVPSFQLTDIDRWESGMLPQPDRVLVLPYLELLHAANADWPPRPPATESEAGPPQPGMEGMEGAEGVSGEEESFELRRKTDDRPPPLLPFDI